MIPNFTSDEEVPRQPVQQKGPRGFVCIDYFVTDPRTGEKLMRSDTLAASVEVNGKTIGEFAAQLYDVAAAGQTNLPARCAGCAFRRGGEGNQSVAAIGTALDAIVSGDTFYCHHGVNVLSDEVGHICHGFQTVNNSAVGSWIRESRKAADAQKK